MAEEFRWGIIGCGGIANKLAKAIGLVDGACVYAAAARDLSRAKAFADQYGAQKAYGSYEELVKDENVDAVYVATIHPYHFDAVKLALEAKKPVLCEKPLTLNADLARKLQKIAQDNDTFLMEAMWTRFIPLYAKLKELIASGEIGDIKRIESDFSVNNKFDPEHRLFSMEKGGGVLVDMGIYPVTAAAIFLGDKPQKIVSDIVPASTGVDAQTSIIMRYAGGRQAVITCSIIASSPLYVHIIGTKGRIYFEEFPGAQSATIMVEGKEPYELDASYGSDNGFEHQVKEVMRCVRAGKKESEILPMSRTIDILELMDTVRYQNNIRYNCED